MSVPIEAAADELRGWGYQVPDAEKVVRAVVVAYLKARKGGPYLPSLLNHAFTEDDVLDDLLAELEGNN